MMVQFPLLATLADKLREVGNCTMLIAAEIEFYLSLPSGTPETPLLSALSNTCKMLPLTVGEVEKERGKGQYEIQISPTADPLLLADTLVRARDIIAETAHTHQATALFAAKPYNDEPGSSIHIHINLFGSNGHNLFAKQGEDDPAILLHAISGLCATMPEMMWIAAPYEASYARFVKHSNAPTTVSWGGNNRTTALRIPLSPPENRRIEHRLAGAEADPHLLIAAILAGMHYGIRHAIPAPAKIYGDASHPQYALPMLPATLHEAREVYAREGRLQGYLEGV